MNLGVAENYVRVVQNMYKDRVTKVRSAVGVMNAFKVEIRLHQEWGACSRAERNEGCRE